MFLFDAGLPRLHVLTVTPFFPSDRNEVSGCFIAEPVGQFRNLGIDSSVIAVSSVYHRKRHMISSAPSDWVRYLQFPPGTMGLSSAGALLCSSLLPRVRKLHKERRIDVIHAHSALPCGHAAALIGKELNIPFVVTVHGLDVFNLCFRGGIPAAQRRRASVMVYRSARSVVCISDKVQEILREGMLNKVSSTVVYNGVDPTLFYPEADNVERLNPEILAVGTLVPSKGHGVLIKAIAELRSRFPGVICNIIGEGPHRAEFENLVRRLQIERHVRFLGRQSRPEVARAMQRCTIFVLPSSNEGFGCVYLEAMSCGKPVVACHGQGIESVIEHGKNGWLISTDRPGELVKSLNRLLASPELCAHLGRTARSTVLAKFTITHQAQNLVAVYGHAVGLG
jgi:teichuronic acid biosynthesis glycosyltransferase TuaC